MKYLCSKREKLNARVVVVPMSMPCSVQRAACSSCPISGLLHNVFKNKETTAAL
jgi:hypothetical protein